MQNLRLECCDCIEFLRSLPDESVDLAIFDPPYYRVIAEKWDRQWATEKEYLDWSRLWTKETARVLKPGSCFYVWGTTKYDTFLRFKLDVMNELDGFFYQNWICWCYDWGGRTKKTFPRKHEDLLMYSKGKEFLFNSDDVRIPYRMPKNIRSTALNNPLGKVPTDVWEQNIHTTSKEYCGWHPTQKPVKLLERIVRANTKQGDVVLDCFSGSGSTAVAALRAGRKFVGCEMNNEYYAQSLVRIEALVK